MCAIAGDVLLLWYSGVYGARNNKGRTEWPRYVCGLVELGGFAVRATYM